MAGLFCFFGFESHHSVFHDVSAQLDYGQKGFCANLGSYAID